MSETFFVLIYVMLLHHGLDYGVVNSEPFSTEALCGEAYQRLEGLAPGEISRIASGELDVRGACLEIKR